jgi:hypothetical protein
MIVGYLQENVCKCLQPLICGILGKPQIDRLPRINPLPDSPDLQIVLRGLGFHGDPPVKLKLFFSRIRETPIAFHAITVNSKRLREGGCSRDDLPLYPVAEFGGVNIRREDVRVLHTAPP